jgi:hypothetical protein
MKSHQIEAVKDGFKILKTKEKVQEEQKAQRLKEIKTKANAANKDLIEYIDLKFDELKEALLNK